MSALQADAFRDILRARTQAVHDRLHDHSSFVALFDQTLTLAGYRDLTRRLYGFYAPLDAAIADTLTGPGAQVYDYAPRSGLLARDLADLGCGDAVPDLPRCARLRDLLSPASLGGVLYVVEGATLGGAIIDRAAQKLLDHDRPDGRRFWAWCRAENKQRWRMLDRHLKQLAASGVAVGDLVTGARATFEVFEDWMAPLDRSRHATPGRQP